MQADALTGDSNENRIGPAVQTSVCKRVLFRQSNCQICVDICPENAITLPFGPELNDACINCGLCQVVCPTEVFDSTQHSDEMIIDILEDQSNKYIAKNKLYVHCRYAESANDLSIAVNCLGNITENSLLAMSNASVQSLMLSTGDCDSCRLCQGRDLFTQSITTYKSLSNVISRPLLTIKSRVSKKHETPKSSTASRRDFFRSIGAGVATQVAKVVVNKEQQIKALLQPNEDTTIQKRLSPRREMLKKLLKAQCESDLDHPVGKSLDYRKMLVDVPHCVGCGVCVSVCPTGALVKEVKEFELTRTINYSLCTNCGVCAEACPQAVISFEEPYSLSDLIGDREEEVARVTLNACLICGEIIPVSEGEVCTTCQKRQVVPMFM